MSMNGIDISGWQSGIDLSKVPCDFVIIKATQGTNIKNKDYDRQKAQAIQCGKHVGVYHYAAGGDPVAEADYFISVVSDLTGKAIFIVDWEGQDNETFGKNDFAWVKAWLDRVFEKTSVRAMIYGSASWIDKFKGIGDHAFWVAQYADNNLTGYQQNPWNEGAFDCAIRQYSSHGRLAGYSGNLDLDKFYGDADQWNAYAAVQNGTAGAGSDETAAVEGTTLELVEKVMRGEYGDGETRKTVLSRRYDEVQNMINHIYSAAAGDLAEEVLAGKYGDGETRKTVLGGRYDEVQNIVNGSAVKYHIVESGDTVSELASENGTTIQQIKDWNNIEDVNLIYVGQRLRVK